MNLEVVGDNASPERLSNCISRLSDQDFDKHMAEYSQRLQRIEGENLKIANQSSLRLVPNL